jgi:hypothetical protein
MQDLTRIAFTTQCLRLEGAKRRNIETRKLMATHKINHQTRIRWIVVFIVLLISAFFWLIAFRFTTTRSYCGQRPLFPSPCKIRTIATIVFQFPCRRWHTVQLVDLAKIADGLHVTTVHSKHELTLRRYHPHQPFPVVKLGSGARKAPIPDKLVLAPRRVSTEWADTG